MLWLISFLIISGLIPGGNADKDLHSKSTGCTLPESWINDQWYQKDFSGDGSFVKISNDSISRGTNPDHNLGSCLQKMNEDHYIFKNTQNGCTKCIFIHSLHENVINYKESECVEDHGHTGDQDHDKLMSDLCEQIDSHSGNFYIFRDNHIPMKCPFMDGQYHFSYSTGASGINCQQPQSTVGSCMNDTQILLNYQGCADVHHSEAKSEEITCIANWKDGDYFYLVAKVDRLNARGKPSSGVDGRFRCFIYEKIKETNPNVRKEDLANIGYKVAISGEATCAGLSSPDSGDKVLVLTKDKDEELCHFPKWFSSQTWHTLDHHLMFQTSPHERSTMLVNLERALERDVTQGAKMSCVQTTHGVKSEVSIVARAVLGCRTQNICLKLSQKTEFISQVRIAEQPTELHDNDFSLECLESSTNSSRLAYNVITVVSDRDKKSHCPLTGQYVARDYKRPGGWIRKVCDSTDPMETLPHKLDIGCLSEPSKMEFLSDCKNSELDGEWTDTIAECIGSWEDANNEVQYMVVSFGQRNGSSHPAIYCFQIFNDTDQLAVSGVLGNCPNGSKLHRTDKSLNFHLLSQGPCISPFDAESGHSGNELALGSGASSVQAPKISGCFVLFMTLVYILIEL